MRTRVTYSARFFAPARAEMLMHDLPFYSTIGTMKIDFSLKDMKQKMAGMTVGQKADYIWTYYKVPILAAAFILVFTFSLVSAIMKNTLSDPVLSYGVVERADVHCGEALDQIAAEAFPDSTGFYAPERCSITSPADENNPYGPVQLAALVSAGDLDVILADKAIADYLVEGGSSSQRDGYQRYGHRKAGEGVQGAFALLFGPFQRRGSRRFRKECGEKESGRTFPGSHTGNVA